jgi:hypothetical protein
MEERFKHLTVGEALELNERAKLTCGWEITTQVGGE